MPVKGKRAKRKERAAARAAAENGSSSATATTVAGSELSLIRPPSKAYITGLIEGFYGTPWSNIQRRQALRLLAAYKMTTYVYAPKDDVRHRERWREKYDTEQAAELQNLIEAARQHGINFVYALSPGNDIEYSNAKDVTACKEKLGQLRSLGCQSFALLFDDIEYKLSDADAALYTTPANAQVTVANDCYAHLNSPTHFYFCPTEYCSTRARPGLLESVYLRTIGDRLHPGIDIFWTGPLVVPRFITPEHCRTVSMVLKRRPLIWDNVFANDYDARRLYLGAFEGRPVGVRNETSGLLLNPNCQWDMNTPAMFTYHEWLLARSEDEHDAQADRSWHYRTRYDPAAVQIKAVAEWMKTFNIAMPLQQSQAHVRAVTHKYLTAQPPPPPPPEMPMETPPSPGEAEMGPSQDMPSPASPDMGSANPTSPLATLHVIGDAIAGSSSVEMSPAGSTLGEEATKQRDEPMDRSPSGESDVSMPEASVRNILPKAYFISFDQMATLMDAYYLPHTHGETAIELLNGFVWLYRQSGTMQDSYVGEVAHQKPGSDEAVISSVVGKVQEAWLAQYIKVDEVIANFQAAFRFLHFNKPLQIMGVTPDLIEKAWGVHGILAVMKALIDWMREGNMSKVTDPRHRRWELRLDLVEPWMVYHAFVDDVAFAMLPNDTSVNFVHLFNNKEELPETIGVLRIRQLLESDADSAAFLARTVPQEHEHLRTHDGFVDRFFTPYLETCPKFCFVAQQMSAASDLSVVASLSCCFDVETFVKERQETHAGRMKEAGLPPDAGQLWLPPMPLDHVMCNYHAYFDLRAIGDMFDAQAAKRLIQTMALAIAYEGGLGLYTAVAPCEVEKTNLLLSLHFQELDCLHTNFILLGLPIRDLDPLTPESETEAVVDVVKSDGEGDDEEKEPSVEERKDDF